MPVSRVTQSSEWRDSDMAALSTSRSPDEIHLGAEGSPSGLNRILIGDARDRLDAPEWAEWGSRGVWHIRSVARNDRHEAEFPEELARRVIRLFSPRGGTVLDPFVGTGTTTAVAKQLGRRWLGIDIDPSNAEMARRRTRDA